jgi:PIN domain nuclease of toxin-antitoxin system
VRLLLDTAVLILSVESPERLSRRAAAVLENGENVLELSSVSISEIAVKATRGKLRLTADLTRQALEDLDVRVLPYSAKHAFALFDLPLHHSDPFDRQIIAQALVEDLPVMTPDRAFSLYKGLDVLW